MCVSSYPLGGLHCTCEMKSEGFSLQFILSLVWAVSFAIVCMARVKASSSLSAASHNAALANIMCSAWFTCNYNQCCHLHNQVDDLFAVFV